MCMLMQLSVAIAFRYLFRKLCIQFDSKALETTTKCLITDFELELISNWNQNKANKQNALFMYTSYRYSLFFIFCIRFFFFFLIQWRAGVVLSHHISSVCLCTVQTEHKFNHTFKPIMPFQWEFCYYAIVWHENVVLGSFVFAFIPFACC